MLPPQNQEFDTQKHLYIASCDKFRCCSYTREFYWLCFTMWGRQSMNKNLSDVNSPRLSLYDIIIYRQLTAIYSALGF